jgi:hypothetical protein
VVHLYESVTGHPWHRHGPCTYCCYSIYRLIPSSASAAVKPAQEDDGAAWLYEWEPLVVNESSYLNQQNLVAEQHE